MRPLVPQLIRSVCRARWGDNPDALQLNQLGTDVKSLQKGLANLTEKVNGLQSKIQVLATASTSTTGATESTYPSAAGSSRLKDITEAALGWMFVQGVVVLLL